jgi:hypothetical protein
MQVAADPGRRRVIHRAVRGTILIEEMARAAQKCEGITPHGLVFHVQTLGFPSAVEAGDAFYDIATGHECSGFRKPNKLEAERERFPPTKLVKGYSASLSTATVFTWQEVS